MDSFKPLVRFAGFEGEWEKVRLSDVAIINPQCSIPDSFEYVDLESVVGTVLYNHRRENKATAPSRAQRLARKGDIFYQTVRPYQRNNYLFELYESDYVFSTGYAQIRSNINPRFLFVVVQSDSFLKQVMDNCTGTSFPAINSTSLKSLIVCNCDSKEQHQISEYFTEIDRAISLQTEKLSKLKQIKAASLQNMFPQEGETVPLVRFSGFGGEWEKVRLGDMFDIGNGYTPSKNVPQFWTNGTIPWFRMEDIRENGRILKDSIQHVTKEAVKSTGLFPANSIIISTTATIGEHALLIADSLANQQFSFLVRKLNRIDSMDIMFIFYHCFLLGDWCRSKSNAGGLLAVNMEDLRNYYFSLPSLPEQQAIANYFTKLDRKIELETQKLEKLKQIKSACLSKMFV